ncbi:hypothetical protein VTG60DRAFT_3906 [Thermothelomyces hinnuleus]
MCRGNLSSLPCSDLPPAPDILGYHLCGLMKEYLVADQARRAGATQQHKLRRASRSCTATWQYDCAPDHHLLISNCFALLFLSFSPSFLLPSFFPASSFTNMGHSSGNHHAVGRPGVRPLWCDRPSMLILPRRLWRGAAEPGPVRSTVCLVCAE